MPLYNWDKAGYENAYNIGAEPDGHPADRPEVRLGYHRAVLLPYAQNLATNLYRVLNWTSSTRLVIVGSGFGWTVECLRFMGMTNVIGVDTSPWVQANKTLNDESEIDEAITKTGLSPSSEQGQAIKAKLVPMTGGGPRSKVAADILNEDVSSAPARARVRQRIGGQPTFEVLTESVIESLTDSEVQAASGFIHQLTSGRVSHLFFPRDDGNFLPLNWKTTQEWKALVPADTFVNVQTWEVL